MYRTADNERAEIRSVLSMAARCADCGDPACMRACPEHMDLSALFRYIAAQAPVPVSWRQEAREAEDFAAAAIERSYE